MAKMKIFFTILWGLGFITFSAGQNLQREKIREIQSGPRSLFFKKGVFHTTDIQNKTPSKIKSVRHAFNKETGIERVVFDFVAKGLISKVYGYISSDQKKIYIDFFNTSLVEQINMTGKSRYVESINFYPISKESLSVEIKLKQKVAVKIFHLSGPARFVLDLK